MLGNSLSVMLDFYALASFNLMDPISDHILTLEMANVVEIRLHHRNRAVGDCAKDLHGPNAQLACAQRPQRDLMFIHNAYSAGSCAPVPVLGLPSVWWLRSF